LAAWLLGERKVEIQIAVRFARMCADSVAKYDNRWSRKSAIYADYVVHAADAAFHAAEIAADAAVTAVDVFEQQRELNKQFLITCLEEYK
jgi:hypothetical protein